MTPALIQQGILTHSTNNISVIIFYYNIRLTALHYAVAINSVACVQLLVSSGYTTHVPSADERSVTPLMMASENSFSDVLMVRLE